MLGKKYFYAEFYSFNSMRYYKWRVNNIPKGYSIKIITTFKTLTNITQIKIVIQIFSDALRCVQIKNGQDPEQLANPAINSPQAVLNYLTSHPELMSPTTAITPTAPR